MTEIKADWRDIGQTGGVPVPGDSQMNAAAYNLHAAQTNTNTDDIATQADDIAAAYVKPGGGIPATDLATAVQTSLGKADSAVQTAAMTAAITAAFNNLVAGAPGALDTWLELTAAIQADETALGALTTLVGQKAPLASPAFTGIPTGVIEPGTHAATSKSTPVDADEIPLVDSAASFGLKKLTWANLKTILFTNPTITNYTETKYAGGNTGTAKTIDLANGTVQAFTLTGNCTFTMPAQPGAGQSKSFSVPLNTGAGGFTAAFTGVKWPASAAPVVTPTAARLDLFTFIADGTNWYGSFAQNFTP